MAEISKKLHPLRWVIWTLAGIFYFYEFFIRVSPSVMVPELMATLKVDATAIGSLSAFYFYIYAPMQLAVGPLTDRYGARRLLAFAAVICGIGTLLFAIAEVFWLAAGGRFLMGIGSSFGFVGMIYVCSHWFEEKKRGIMIGLANTIGMLGAIMGEGPLRISVNIFGGRESLLFVGGFGILLAVVIFLLVRNDPPGAPIPQTGKHHIGDFWKNLLVVTKNGSTWLNGVMSLFFYVATPAFAGLWGIPYLHATYGMSTVRAGFAISMIFVGWAIGGPIIGIFADWIKQKKSILLLSTACCLFLMSIIIYIHPLPIPLLFILLAGVGVFSSAQLLNFSYCIDVNPLYAKGTATAMTNFIVIIGSASMQPLVGYFLDKNWAGTVVDGIRIYPPAEFQQAMSVFPACFIIAFILCLFMKRVPKR